MGMLGSLSARAMAIWVLSVLGMLFLAGFLASRVVTGEQSEFFLEIPPIRVPSVENVAIKTASRAVWYLKEAVPLFALGTFVLFVLDRVALLGVIEKFASPVIVGVLGLPERATQAFLIGFLRRDYGAAGLFAMSEEGLLTPEQSIVSLVTLTLFVPCLAHFLMMVKERGLRMSLGILAIITPAAIAAGGLLNWALRAFGITV
jgi:ferrous iron transport protein B